MKKILSIMALILLAAAGVYSQSPAPGIFNYQGVARNSVGNVLVNKTISLRLTVHDGSAAGPTVYQESRTVTTNPFGLFNVQVGSAGATSVTGTIAGVNWGVGNKYIQVEIDPNGGSTFINIGTAQIASVPYSLYSSLSNDLVLPFIKTQAASGSTLIGITNSATTGTQGAFTGTSASTDGNAFAITGTISSTSPGGFSTGVRGINNGTGGLGIGVWGSQNGSGWGVYGQTPSGIGVYGNSTSGFGVYGASTSGNGVNGTSTSGYGVSGTSAASNAAGVLGDGSGTGNSSGVMGRSGEGSYPGFSTNAGVTGRANANYGVAGYAITGTGGYFTSTSGLALNTAGNLRHTGIGEALNRILRSDAVGNATWVDPAAVGIVTGSGTVNYVPKWTPVGTNLGNSQIFDNGTNIGIANSSPTQLLHISSGGNPVLKIEGAVNSAVQGAHIRLTETFGSDYGFDIFADGGNDNLIFRGMEANAITADNILVVKRFPLANAAVGVGTVPASSKLEVLTTVANSAGSFTVNNAASTADALFATTNTTSTTPAAIHGVNGVSGLSVVAKKGIWGESDNGLGIAGFSSTNNAIFGVSNSGIAGVVGGNFSGFSGVYATHTGSGYGLYATSNLGTAGRFENTNAANTAQIVDVTSNGTGNGLSSSLSNAANIASAIRGLNTATNPGSWGILATSVTGTGYPGEANPAALVAQTNNSYGIVTSSVNSYGLRSGSANGTAIWGEAYFGSGAGVFGTGNFGGTYGVVGNAAAGAGAGGYFTGGTTALRTLGGLQLTGINEGVNRILTTVPGTGQATWEDAATVGIVSGSGTLNFVPKWTPTGTNLGNSNIWVDASNTSTQINTTAMPTINALNVLGGWAQIDGTGTFPFLHLNSAGNSSNGGIIFGSSTGGPDNGRILYRTAGDYIAIAHRNGGAGTNGLSDLVVKNSNVGIGTTAPATRLNVIQTDATAIQSDVNFTTPVSLFSYRSANITSGANSNMGLLSFNNTSSSVIPGWKAGVVGVDSSNDLFASGVAGLYKGNTYGTGVYGASAQNRSFESIATTSTLGFVGGQFRGGDVGVVANASFGTGSAADKYGVYATALSGAATNNYGIYAQAGGASNNWAGFFNGRVAITDGTQGAGYVFTSDASGNGSWQNQNVGIGLQNLSADVVIPPAGFLNITNWNTITHETGGANYNAGTGEYTITIAGVYQINASLAFSPGAPDAIDMILRNNGGAINEITQYIEPTGFVYGMNLNCLRHLNVGDKLLIEAGHSGAAAVTLIASFMSNNFSVQLVTRD